MSEDDFRCKYCGQERDPDFRIGGQNLQMVIPVFKLELKTRPTTQWLREEQVAVGNLQQCGPMSHPRVSSSVKRQEIANHASGDARLSAPSIASRGRQMHPPTGDQHRTGEHVPRWRQKATAATCGRETGQRRVHSTPPRRSSALMISV